MRQLTSLTNDEHARRFTAYLFTQGIDAQLEQDAEQWLIWVREEDSLEPARELYNEFRADPNHERYQGAVQTATTMQLEEAKRRQQEQSQRNHIEMRDQWRQGRLKRNNPLTRMLIILSIVVTLFSGGLNSGKPDNAWLRHLMFADSLLVNRIPRDLATTRGELERDKEYLEGIKAQIQKAPGSIKRDEETLRFKDQVVQIVDWMLAELEKKLVEVEKEEEISDKHYYIASISLRKHPWELWRLVTPIFLHASVFGGYGILHLVFNMLWLNDLGSVIEHRYGTPRFGAMILVIAVLSVLAQSLAPTTWGPFSGTWAHGGMSGVVYGLVGFIWIRTRLDPTSRLRIRPELVMFMIVWLFLCVFLTQGGMLVANLAHAAGLLSGMLVARVTLPKRS